MSRASVFALLALGAASVAASSALAQDAGANRYGSASDPRATMSDVGAPAAAGALSLRAIAPRAMSAGLRGRMLNWPGKVQGPALTSAAYAPPPQAYARPSFAQRGEMGAAYDRSGYAPRGRPSDALAGRAATPQRYQALSAPRADPGDDGQSGYASPPSPRQALSQQRTPVASPDAAPDGWRPVFAAKSSSAPAGQVGSALAGAPTRTDLPTSIYSPGPVAAAKSAAPRSGWAGSRAASMAPPMRTATADRRYGYDPMQQHGVRFYSVHRAFGMKPDPAPIPPQFFTATADLADPPGPLPTDRTTVSGGTTHVNRAVSDIGAN